MVVAEIGEDGGIEEDAVHPPLGEGVGRHLHGRRKSPGPAGLVQDLLDHRRLRCRPHTVERADDCARRTVFIEDRRQQMGDRRLAVRPRDAHRHERPGRVVVEGAGDTGHRRPGRARRHHHLGHRQRQRALDQQAHGAGLDGGRGERMTVGLTAGQTEEQGPGGDESAVELDRRHLLVGDIAARRHDLDSLEQPVHAHSRGPATGRITAFPWRARPRR